MPSTPDDEPGRPGRPRLIPYKTDAEKARTLTQLKAAGQIQATAVEVAALFGVGKTALYQFFIDFPEGKAAWKDGMEEGRMSLRRTQFDLAKKHPQMAIWLGKQHLGQVDRREVTGAGGGDIKHTVHMTQAQLAEEILKNLDEIAAEEAALDDDDDHGIDDEQPADEG